MIVQFVADDKDKAQRRLTSFGVDLTVEEAASWDVAHEGIDIYLANEGEASLAADALTVGVRRNAVLVVVNPKLGEAVGYQPAAPQFLFPGYWGGVDVKFRSLEDAIRAGEHLGGDWGVRLCLVQVGAPGRD